MFCASLRRRRSYASVLNSLTAPSSLGLRENDLRTHDVFLPLPPAVNPHTRSTRHLRVLLLSPSTISEKILPTTMERIRRFASLTGGQDLAIVFLLYPGNDTSEEASTAGMIAYAKLQAEMMDHGEIPAIPILPLPKVEGLSNLLKRHQAALSALRPPATKRFGTTSFELLRQCSNEPPMAESAAFMLTDLFSNLCELADACTTASTVQDSRSPSAGTSGVHTTVRSRTGTAIYDNDGDYTANDTQVTDDGSFQSKLTSFRDLTSEDQYRVCWTFGLWSLLLEHQNQRSIEIDLNEINIVAEMLFAPAILQVADAYRPRAPDHNIVS